MADKLKPVAFRWRGIGEWFFGNHAPEGINAEPLYGPEIKAEIERLRQENEVLRRVVEDVAAPDIVELTCMKEPILRGWAIACRNIADEALASHPSQANPVGSQDKANLQDNDTTLYRVIADIREKSGVGVRPMLSELADAIADKLHRNEKEAASATAEKDGLLEALHHHTGCRHGVMAIRMLVERAEQARTDGRKEEG